MPIRILGIDPGMAAMGYGLIENGEDKLGVITYGALTTTPDQAVSQRLSSLYQGIRDVIERYQPAEVAVELFVARNLRTALMVGQARGGAILACGHRGLPVYE